MFLNKPIFPKAKVKWAYPVVVSIIWVSFTYWLRRTISPSAAALDVATVFMASIVLAYYQHSFHRDQ